MQVVGSGRAGSVSVRLRRRALSLAGALVLATTLGPLAIGSASARTFDYSSTGSLVQQPLPSHWACAMRRALAGRQVSCS
jgi:hypothetical protein